MSTSAHGNGFSFWVTWAFTINYIVGVGILDMPKKFYGAGVALSSIALFCSCCVLLVTLLWTIEALARALGLAALVLRTDERIDHDREGINGYESTPVSLSDTASQRLLVASTDGDASASAATKPISPAALAAAASSSGVPLSQRVGDALRHPSPLLISRLQYVHCDCAHLALSFSNTHLTASLHPHTRRSESATLSYDLDCESVDEVAVANRGSLFALNELLDMFCPPWAKTVYELSIAALLLMYVGGA
jgi:hypothetical protein